MALVEVGGNVVKTYPLDTWHNVVCLLLGSMSLVAGVVVKFMPLEMF